MRPVDVTTQAYVDEIVADFPALDDEQAELIGHALRDSLTHQDIDQRTGTKASRP